MAGACARRSGGMTIMTVPIRSRRDRFFPDAQWHCSCGGASHGFAVVAHDISADRLKSAMRPSTAIVAPSVKKIITETRRKQALRQDRPSGDDR